MATFIKKIKMPSTHISLQARKKQPDRSGKLARATARNANGPNGHKKINLAAKRR